MITPKERHYFPALFWGHKDNPDRYRAKEIRYVKCTKARAVTSPECGGGFFLISHDFTLFPSLSGSVLPAALSLKSAIQLLCVTFGISRQDGYSRGSSRTSFSQAVSPWLLPSQPRPSS